MRRFWSPELSQVVRKCETWWTQLELSALPWCIIQSLHLERLVWLGKFRVHRKVLRGLGKIGELESTDS